MKLKGPQISYNTLKNFKMSETNHMECYFNGHDDHCKIAFEETNAVLFDNDPPSDLLC